MISVRNLTKIYKLKGSEQKVVALNSVNIDFPDKGLVFLLGKSGSGKSTLLNSIGGLDTFDSGEIIIKGKSSKDFKQSDFDSYRNTFIGFIFQEYNILEEFTVGKNLSLALELQGKKVDKATVNKLLDEVDLTGYYKRKPNQLSGGQKQRVAIARALIKDPEIIMADEPTGALDSATGKQVMDTLKKLSKSKLVIIVSHDREFAEIYGDRIIELKDGSVIRDETKTEVEAQKSSSGVSFIDNEIIHIKKGQEINKEDLEKINQMIINNAKNSDTIISFDDKSNETVKKTAFITDDGNREVFQQTKEEDIERQKHDPKNFKMIKSKLKFKDSFKMGASSLKHKPVRLVFTILLAVIAFTLFGVVNTLGNFNRADAVYETVEKLNIETLVVTKSVEDYYDEYLISDKEYDYFQNKFEDYDIFRIINSGDSFSIVGESSSNSDYTLDRTVKRRNISGMMPINNNILSSFKLGLIHGELPSLDNQICISANMYNTIIELYSNVNNFEELKEKEIYIDGNNYQIVGVIQDDTDVSEYADLDGQDSNYNKNYQKYEELDQIMNYSLINMCYVTEDCYNNLYATSNNRNSGGSYYQAYRKGEDNYGGTYIDFYKATNYLDNSYVQYGYIKEGVSLNSLSGDQTIISKSLLIDTFGIAEEDLINKINEGLTVNFAAGYGEEKNHAFSLTVVGLIENNSSLVLLSDEHYKDYFEGADYLITRLHDNSDDRSLIRSFENHNKTVFRFKVQCPATSILDNFGSFISGAAKIFLYIGIGLAVFAGFMLMNFISTSISYKKREIGVLRAIGARGKDVFSIFFSESFIICMINFVLSWIACSVTCTLINNGMGDAGIKLVLMMFGPQQVLLLFGISLLVAFVASFLPVFKCARKNPIDSINNR